MNESAVLSSPGPVQTAEAPAPVFNCPECSQWLPPGSLACPACGAVVYTRHLHAIAQRASAAENSGQWAAARDLWQSALTWLQPGTTQYQSIAEHAARLDAQTSTAQQAAAESEARWTRRLGPLAKPLKNLTRLAPLGYFLLKFKFIFSFLGFFAVYWALFGPWFGFGFTVAILLHEMGHYIAAKRLGLKVDLPVFLPGMGAYVRWYAAGMTLEDLSSIALAGPFSGLLSAIGFGAASFFFQGKTHDLLCALAHVSAWLNLLNLTPVFGLDGAKATLALDRTQRALVMVTALLGFGFLHEWTFLIVAAGMLWQLIRGSVPEQPSTRTLIRYVLLLFTLGMVILRFPDTTRTF